VSKDWCSPGDRRRFAGFAARHAGEINVAGLDGHELCDATVMTLGGDLSRWREFKSSGSALILDMVDSYFDEPKLTAKALGRGIYKSVSGQFSRTVFDFQGLISDVVKNADAVVCASLEQRDRLAEMNPNTYNIVDCMDEVFELRLLNGEVDVFTELPSHRRFLWEGYPENLRHFKILKEAFGNLNEKKEWSLDVVTNSNCRIFGPITMSTRHLLRRVPIESRIHPWSLSLLAKICGESHLGLIPIDPDDRMAFAKSENKLLGFWALGMPVLVSSTPSYSRVANEAGVPSCLVATADWNHRLAELDECYGTLVSEAISGFRYALSKATSVATDADWVRVLRSVGIEVTQRHQ